MPHSTPRQPVSCENCRKRKIRCLGDRTPCETCVRRGYPHSCHYKRSSGGQPQINSTENELLTRVRNLEDLLKQTISQSAASLPDPIRSSSTANSDRSSLYTESYATLPTRQSGHLVTSPDGYQRFIPASSTLDTNVVQEFIEAVPAPALALGFPFSEGASSSRRTLLDILPPFRQCDELKGIFFQVFSPLFHVLHDPTFDIAYVRFQEDPSSVSLSWLALLFVMLAIAVTALGEEHPLLRDLGRESTAAANLKSLSAKFRSAAMQCLSADQFLYHHNLHTVQTLVLLVYAMNHANVPAWALLGTTLNIAIAVGCHIDPARLGTFIRPIEQEERRRVWAALMMLYTIQNTCLGNIAPVSITADVDLPVDRDDEDLEDGVPPSHQSPGCLNQATKMSYILYKFRLYKIAADVCQVAPYNAWAKRADVFALDRRLEEEQKEHAIRFSTQTLPLYHVVHHYILQSYTCHLYLILHRPFLKTTSDLNGLESSELQMHFKSHERCQASATTILEIHQHLYGATEYRPYRWYVYGLGSFQAFLAVSTLIVLLATSSTNEHDKSRIRTICEQCLRRFEAMADMSDVCLKASTVLRQALPQKPVDSTLVTPQRYQDASNINLSVPTSDLQQYPTSPQSNPDRMSYVSYPGSYDWTAVPQFRDAFFEMSPEQFMTPTTFSWDRWNHVGMS